jgi:hypothetical protein
MQNFMQTFIKSIGNTNSTSPIYIIFDYLFDM